AGRRVRPHVLLVEDHLLLDGGAPSAVLLGPAHARPPAGAERALPRQPDVEALVLVARAAARAQRGELAREVLGQPRPHLVAEGLVLGREAQVHGPLAGARNDHVLGFSPDAAASRMASRASRTAMRSCPTAVSRRASISSAVH